MRGNGDNKAWSPGRSRISRKAIAQGMFWRKNINKNKGKGALYPPLCRDPLRPKIAVQNLRRATMHWLLASCLSPPQWLCFRASQGRALAHSRAERVPECTTGQTRTTGRSCAIPMRRITCSPAAKKRRPEWRRSCVGNRPRLCAPVEIRRKRHSRRRFWRPLRTRPEASEIGSRWCAAGRSA
jgi:hypothetical protein